MVTSVDHMLLGMGLYAGAGHPTRSHTLKLN